MKRCQNDVHACTRGGGPFDIRMVPCGHYVEYCPVPACESSDFTDTCLNCMDTRNVAGIELPMCVECCSKYDNPEERTPEWSAWLERQEVAA